jgi:hypothetical protein
VQVDPIKPKLKAPGSKRLKLKNYDLLSNIAFKCKLRRYTKSMRVPLQSEMGRGVRCPL